MHLSNYMSALKPVLTKDPAPYNKGVMIFMQILIATPFVIFTLYYSLSNSMFALFSLIGISMFIYKRQWKELDLKVSISHPVVLSLLFLVTIYFSAITQNVWETSDTRKLEDMSWILLLLGLIPLNRRWGSSDTFWWGVIGCAILSGGIALYDVYNHGLNIRVTGSKGKPIMFGDIAMIASTLSILAVIHFKKRGLVLQLLASAATLMGLFGSLLSGTRGAWLFLPVFAIIFMFYFIKKYNTLKLWALFALSLFALLSVLVLTPSVSSRIDIAVKQVNDYVTKKPNSTATSIGQRFELWRAGLEIFSNHPLTGVGISQLKNHYKVYVEQGGGRHIGIYDHAHNEYFNTLISRGLVGFVGLMILLLGSANFFYRGLDRNPTIALAGITLVSGYATFGLTDSIFFFKFSLIFFFSCLYLLSDALVQDSAI